eukprot:Amastigsp_a182750_32.p3 type:complete len:127 gc:universal Amastigsp_a182750_32:512-892(+)
MEKTMSTNAIRGRTKVAIRNVYPMQKIASTAGTLNAKISMKRLGTVPPPGKNRTHGTSELTAMMEMDRGTRTLYRWFDRLIASSSFQTMNHVEYSQLALPQNLSANESWTTRMKRQKIMATTTTGP